MIINATHIGKKLDGIGRFSLKIAKHFLRKYQVIINENAIVHFNNEELKNLKIVSKKISPDYGFKGHLKRLIFTNLLKGNIFNLSQLEISFWNKNQIIVVHDIIPLLFPKYHKKQYHFFKYILPFVLKNKTKKIITVSNHTKELLIRYYNVNPTKIEVIYNGVDIEFDYSLEKENIIFFVGRNSPTKNIENIIKSFIELKKDSRFNDFKLVLGGVGNLSLNIKDIIIKNYLTDNELKYYYRIAKVFLFPSLYEGFGFPIIEAMRAKTACIVSNRGSLPEIVGDSALIVDPLNVNSIVEALKKILLDEKLRKNLEIKGYKNSLKFNWDKSLLKYERVLNENSISS
ncbi:hypothetical protein JCM14244_11600 [Venenivibrio stagnispumantis]|uniref:Glycosyltransferase involved in cell wall bisynthesis n=1 Tax=Venenivibrio stagnispumantis TaxID=407998 RepID=A0AA46AG19_9AQUI|nr:glycosyltransferase family 1 protein [Venenivibrio stagnispumantis]MCW4573223.1 glycosyltransferase family 4 protein [Venenivibrio stagnispumantis]SMP24288.1 Glycosyltransferase involved in cell wall bisynthesis [Venenivibrio stagnispumantis]